MHRPTLPVQASHLFLPCSQGSRALAFLSTIRRVTVHPFLLVISFCAGTVPLASLRIQSELSFLVFQVTPFRYLIADITFPMCLGSSLTACVSRCVPSLLVHRPAFRSLFFDAWILPFRKRPHCLISKLFFLLSLPPFPFPSLCFFFLFIRHEASPHRFLVVTAYPLDSQISSPPTALIHFI